MHDKPVGRGYVHLSASEHMPWAGLQEQAVRGHEFHYASLDGLPSSTRYAWQVTRGHGIDGHNDGVVQGNLLASFAHLRTLAGTDWARHFIDFVCARPRPGQACMRSTDTQRMAA